MLFGRYFMTVCSYGRQCIFGEIADGTMRSNIYGDIVLNEWRRTATLGPYLTLDAFVVMPNRAHGIIMIRGSRGTARLYMSFA